MATVSSQRWGEHQGKEVRLFTIVGDGIRIAVSNYGGILQSFLVEDAKGVPTDIVLGYDTLAQYLQDDYFFGAMIGPIADRMAGGTCRLGGRDVQLPLNAGPDSMHSGPHGFHSQVWDWEQIPDGVAFHGQFMHPDMSFPGELTVRLTYRLSAPDTLRIEYAASSTAEMAFSFTNHSYFNLDGARRDCRDHILWLNSNKYAQTTCTDAPLITGRLVDTEGSPMDFSSPTRIVDSICHGEHQEIASAGGVDHFYMVDGEGFRKIATLSSPESGLCLTCSSDADGILVYTGNGISNRLGKQGIIYQRNWGVCLETGQLPNAVNLPAYRDRVVRQPGTGYHSATEFVVSHDLKE
jgi:aldose 1-epimerase